MEKKDRYKAARQHARLTQVQLAEKVPMSQQMVSKLEKGLTTESAFDVRIAVVCGVRAEWLDAEEGEMVGSSKPPAANPKLKADLEATNNALAAFAIAAARSTPKLAGAFLGELNKMPDDYKNRSIYAVLIELLEHGAASQAAAPKHRQGRAIRGSAARSGDRLAAHGIPSCGRE